MEEFLSSIMIVEIGVPANAEPASNTSDEGKQIDCSEKQQLNTDGPISRRFEGVSNSIVERRLHPLKHDSHRIETEDGMQIDVNDEQPKKASDSIRSSREPGSNFTAESERQSWKHDLHRTTTDDGMQIDENFEEGQIR
jgi:hypothetical protein